jgi:F1F0 ATPase subunit 2
MMPPWIWKGIIGFVVGLAVGAVYFAGLWWTARRLIQAARPQLFAFASFIVRAILLGTMLVAVASAGPAPLFASIAGFTAAWIGSVRWALRGGENA